MPHTHRKILYKNKRYFYLKLCCFTLVESIVCFNSIILCILYRLTFHDCNAGILCSENAYSRTNNPKSKRFLPTKSKRLHWSHFREGRWVVSKFLLLLKETLSTGTPPLPFYRFKREMAFFQPWSLKFSH